MRFVEFFDKLPSIKAKALLVVIMLLVVGRIVGGNIGARYSSVRRYSKKIVLLNIISWPLSSHRK